MTIQNTLKTWTKFLHKDVYVQRDEYRTQVLEYNSLLKNEHAKINCLTLEIQDQAGQIAKLKQEAQGKTKLERFCEREYTEVSKFAYKDKGLLNDERFTMYPNELIQPNIYLIKAFKERLTRNDDDKDWVYKLAQKVNRTFKWTADATTDGLVDVYQTIYQTMLRPKQDCEQHAAVLASCDAELIGMAFGFAGTTGHAFNVFVYKDELWCAETNNVWDTDSATRVFKYKDQSHYKIHFIFTQNRTYRVRGGVHFGKVTQ